MPNKIFVGEASYGRSFRMAVDGCWGPMGDFTGTRTESYANLGRCMKTGRYIANAEINEIIRIGTGWLLHDHESNPDVLLYKCLIFIFKLLADNFCKTVD